jgi:hypothetical protein
MCSTLRRRNETNFPGEEPCDESDPSNVRVAILTGEAQSLGQVGPNLIAVQNLDGIGVRLERRDALHCAGDVRNGP